MKSNIKKKLTFAAMSSNPRASSSNRATVSHRTSNAHSTCSKLYSVTESGARFRSVSMSVVESPPLFAQSTPFGELSKSHSTPMPDGHDAQAKTPSSRKSRSQEQWVWKLTPQQLLAVPVYHPMERTAITVSDVPLEEITRRISTFLKHQSIPAKYEDEHSRVSCMTEGLVKFVVQLWQNFEGAVVVEIQRRQGCCITMQAIRHHLLEAIQTEVSYGDLSKPTRTTCSIVQNLVEQSTGMLPPPPLASTLPCSTAALDLAKRLLESERFDAQRLALESLCSLTNPTQVLLRDADQVSRSILCEPEWQALMGRYFRKNHLGVHWQGTQAYQDDTMKLDYEQGELIGELHFLALKVVSQAIESLVTAPEALEFSAPFWTAVLEALYYNLKVAEHRPLEAAWSIRCFRHLQAVQPELLQLIPSKHGLYECLIHAHDFGTQHHRSLELETEQWMGRLGFAF
jgi:hypothetical protein